MSLRAIGVGLIGIVLITWIVAWAELVTGQIMIGFLQVPPVVVAGLFVLVLLTKMVRRVAPRWALQSQELVVVYCMMLIGAMIASRGLMEDLLPMLVGQNYYADPGNRWADIFFVHIPTRLVPWDPGAGSRQAVATAFYEGLREGEVLPWAAWVRPLTNWLLLVAAIYFIFLCLAAILRRQWSDNERLSYPLVQLPLEMIREQPGRSFFQEPLTWIGFAIPTILFGLNGLHNIRPDIPGINVEIWLGGMLHVPPWSEITFFTAYISPGATGFFYLLPSELLFSFWFFHLLAKVQDAIVAALALPPIQSPHASGNGYMDYQTAGAYFMLVAYLGTMAWPHLKAVLRHAVSRHGDPGITEMMPSRFAIWGIVAGFVTAALWLHSAGMGIGYAVFALLVYVFIEAIVMARGTTEGGLPMTEGCFTPLDISALVVPPYTLGARTLTGAAFFDTLFARDLRGLVFTGFLDGQRMADQTGLSRRRLLWIFVIALIAAVLASTVVELWLPYHRGALNMYSYTYWGNSIQMFRENAALLQGQTQQTTGATSSFLAGALVTAGLSMMRARYAGWPFHPLGYAMSTSWTTMVFWFPMFIAWLLKWIIVHFGGMKLYARARPLFLGLIFGEFTAAVGWTLIAATWGVKAPFFPWP